MKLRAFELGDQQDFAEATGDWNPMHLDPVYARRLPNGLPLVHGMHTLLWSLDWALRSSDGRVKLDKLKATFAAPLPVGRHVRLAVEGGEHDFEVTATTESTLVMKANLSLAAVDRYRERPSTLVPAFPPRKPHPRSFDSLTNFEGSRALAISEPSQRLFPNIFANLDFADFEILLGLSPMVGMDCPGLQSIFAGFSLERRPPRQGAASEGGHSEKGRLRFATRRVDSRFGRIDLALESHKHVGRAQTFLRPEPKAQKSFAAYQAEVAPREFEDQRALVVGGSRGLGEAVAKTVAAGGGQVLLTYHNGHSDAQALVDEISAAGGNVACAQLDAREPSSVGADFQPTHVYYLATPPIFVGGRGTYSDRLFDEFRNFYVTGLASLAESLRDIKWLCIVAPSSEAVTDRPMGMEEYADAKEAQERWAEMWMLDHPSHLVICDRYPRLATDQTQSNVAAAAPDPSQFIIQRVREAAVMMERLKQRASLNRNRIVDPLSD